MVEVSTSSYCGHAIFTGMNVADPFISRACLVTKSQMSANQIGFCGYVPLVMKLTVSPLVSRRSYWIHAKVLKAYLPVFSNACLLSWTRQSAAFVEQVQD